MKQSSGLGFGAVVFALLACTFIGSALGLKAGDIPKLKEEEVVYSPPLQPTPTPTPTGSSNPPATPGAPPCTNCGGDLPSYTLTGYWQNFTNGSTSLRLNDINDNYDLIVVAFASPDASRPGGITFTVDSTLAGSLGGYTEAAFTSDIASLHGKGKKVIISVGGQNSTISVDSATNAENFATSIYELMTTYGFDGIDIDLEHGINSTYMADALRKLSGLAGPDLIIAMAPQTIDMQSTSAGYFQLALAIKDILTVVNMQYYNSGTMQGCDGNVYAQGTVDFLTALACIQLQNGLRPDQVGLGLPATSEAAGGGYMSPSLVRDALSCLARGTNCGSFKPSTTYPDIRGAMTWSINWDATSNYNFANTLASLPG